MFAAVTLATVIRESRREATQRGSVLPGPESRRHDRACPPGRLRRHNRRVTTTAFVNGAVFDGHHHLGHI